MKKLHLHIVTAALLAGVGIAAVAQPQTAPAPMGRPGAMQAQPGQPDGARMERFRARHQERMQQRLADLKALLKISPAQEGAWTSWTAALQPNPNAVQRPARGEMLRLTTPERIDRMRALRAQRNAEMDRRLEATKVFYTALSAEQKAAFDAVSLRFTRKGFGGGRGGRGGHGGFGGHHGRG